MLVGCQRIVAGAHYPSDVLLGAAIGSFVAAVFLDFGRLARWFDRWEGRE
jgi:membrane-associated phospholipid phosphatase